MSFAPRNHSCRELAELGEVLVARRLEGSRGRRRPSHPPRSAADRSRVAARQCPAADGGEAEMAFTQLDRGEPAKQREAFVEQAPARRRRLRQAIRASAKPGVVVGEACLRPWPARVFDTAPRRARVRANRTRPRQRSPVASSTTSAAPIAAQAFARGDGESKAGAPDSKRSQRPPGELARGVGEGDAETVERPTLRVVRADLVGEDAGGAGGAAVVEAAVPELRLLDEPEVDAGEAQPAAPAPGRRPRARGRRRRCSSRARAREEA